MSRALSPDVRVRVLAAVAQGLSHRQAVATEAPGAKSTKSQWTPNRRQPPPKRRPSRHAFFVWVEIRIDVGSDRRQSVGGPRKVLDDSHNQAAANAWYFEWANAAALLLQ